MVGLKHGWSIVLIHTFHSNRCGGHSMHRAHGDRVESKILLWQGGQSKKMRNGRHSNWKYCLSYAEHSDGQPLKWTPMIPGFRSHALMEFVPTVYQGGFRWPTAYNRNNGGSFPRLLVDKTVASVLGTPLPPPLSVTRAPALTFVDLLLWGNPGAMMWATLQPSAPRERKPAENHMNEQGSSSVSSPSGILGWL